MSPLDVVYPPNGNMPAPLSSDLDDVLMDGGAPRASVRVFVAHNLGNRSFLTSLPMEEFHRLSDVANDPEKHGDTVAQRKLDPEHARKLAVYMLKGLVSIAISTRLERGETVPQTFLDIQATLGTQPYMSLQPIVTNLRACKKLGKGLRAERMVSDKTGETACFKVELGHEHTLWVVDGQHRRKGMDYLFQFLDHIRTHQAYPKKKQSLFPSDTEQATPEELALWSDCSKLTRSHATVQVEVHLGLTPDEERQLFHDLNNLGKRVEKNLALKFDHANPVNAFIKDHLIGTGVIDISEKDFKDWDQDTGAIPHKDLVAINAHLFLNKTNISGATPPVVSERTPVAMRFWTAVLAIPSFGEHQARKQTVAAQPVVLKALAKLTFDFAWGRSKDQSMLDKLLDGISGIDFSHQNPMWRYYDFKTPEERLEHGLKGLDQYMPSDADGKNRDVGAYQGGFMRFGAKHNDIFPLIGDMIRWKLGLPSRHQAGHVDDEE